MKQMGIAQEEINASRVIIEKEDNSKIIIENPSVTKVKMQGQETFQIAGEIQEESGEEFSEDDIKIIVEKTGCTHDQAKEVLESVHGDLAEAILELSE